MNIEDMQKIWSSQEQKVYYAIDEETLFERIQQRTRRLQHAVSRDELGLILISVIAVVVMLFTKVFTVFNLITIFMLIAIGVFVYFKRRQRMRKEAAYGLSVHDNIEHAIELAKYRIKSAKSFVWWYILPLALPTFGNMYYGNAKEPKHWLLIGGAFVLSFLLIRWELVKHYRPTLTRLEKIKGQIEAT